MHEQKNKFRHYKLMPETPLNQNHPSILNRKSPHLTPHPAQPLINIIPARAFAKKAPGPQLKAMASNKIEELKIQSIIGGVAQLWEKLTF
jgi:hypothetical protein